MSDPEGTTEDLRGHGFLAAAPDHTVGNQLAV